MPAGGVCCVLKIQPVPADDFILTPRPSSDSDRRASAAAVLGIMLAGQTTGVATAPVTCRMPSAPSSPRPPRPARPVGHLRHQRQRQDRFAHAARDREIVRLVAVLFAIEGMHVQRPKVHRDADILRQQRADELVAVDLQPRQVEQEHVQVQHVPVLPVVRARHRADDPVELAKGFVVERRPALRAAR